MTLPGPPTTVNRMLLRGPALVGRDDVAEREQVLDRLEEHEPAGTARVALVAALDRRPLVAAHRARAGVGQQVDQHVLGVEVEQVPAGGLERRLALGLGGQPDGLHGVDPERLDDRLPAVHGGEHTARRSVGRGTLRAWMTRPCATSSSSGSWGRARRRPGGSSRHRLGWALRDSDRRDRGPDRAHGEGAAGRAGDRPDARPRGPGAAATRSPVKGRTSSAAPRPSSTGRTASTRSGLSASPWPGSPSRRRPRRSGSPPAPIDRGMATIPARSSRVRHGSGIRRSGRSTR